MPDNDMMEARELVRELIGGRATVSQDERGSVVKFALDRRPLIVAARSRLDNLVAGACY
jgi:hypothetical protein